MNEKNVKRLIIGVIFGIFAFILVFSSLTKVAVGSTGVKIVLGKVQEETLSEGLHFKIPFICKVVDINNKVQKVDIDAASTSKDLQPISCKVSVNYHLSAESSASMYQNIGDKYSETLLQPAIQESVKSVMAKYNAEGLITNRSTVGIEISDEVTNKVSEYGIIIDKFNIVNFNFSAEFNKAIEAKQVAEQNKIKAQTENEQKIMEAEAEAAKTKVDAEAKAEAKKIQAQADAEAIKTKAEAQANANKKLNESLTSNVIEYKKAETWNGEYPNVIAGDSSGIIVNANE